MIEGVLSQKTAFPFELVIGDDASTDGTRDVIAQYRQQAPGVIRPVFHEKNIGVTRNTVRTLEQCTGEYVALLDGDDYWTAPEKLQIQVDLLDAHPETAICGHRVRLQCEAGVSSANTPYDLVAGFYPDTAAGSYTIEDLLQWDFVPNSSAMLRNGLIGEFPNWFYEAYVQDWPLLLLSARRGNIVLLDEIMAAYRIHASSFTSSNGEIVRMQGKIRLLDAFAGDCEKKYQPVIRAKQFQSAWWLSKLLLADGKIGEARRWYRRCLSLSPPTAHLKLKAILGLQAYAPELSKFLQGAKRKLRPGRRKQESGTG